MSATTHFRNRLHSFAGKSHDLPNHASGYSCLTSREKVSMSWGNQVLDSDRCLTLSSCRHHMPFLLICSSPFAYSKSDLFTHSPSQTNDLDLLFLKSTNIFPITSIWPTVSLTSKTHCAKPTFSSSRRGQSFHVYSVTLHHHHHS